jgi:arylsulfatase A-like enzyme
LPLEEVTLAEALKEGGYRTFFAGKWHLGGRGYWPENQGFDINVGGWTAGAPASYFSPYHNPKLSDGPTGEHLDDRMAAESVKFLEGVGQQPFLLYHAFYSVHIPLQATRTTRSAVKMAKAFSRLLLTTDRPEVKMGQGPPSGPNARPVRNQQEVP